MSKSDSKRSHPAAFINVIAEDRCFDEAIHYLQDTWNDLCNLKIALVKLGFTNAQINKMQEEAGLGKVF